MADSAVQNAVGVASIGRRVTNPIRKVVDQMKRPDLDIPFISLSIGDPTITGIFRPPVEVTTALHAAIDAHNDDGYPPSTGTVKARAAIATAYSTPRCPIAVDDVVIASGASHALEMAIEALCPPKSVLLVPRPGFSLYATIASAREIDVVYYDLDSENNWETNLPALREILASRAAPVGAATAGTADGLATAIILNNPSNPCGSAWSAAHSEAVASLLAEYPGVTAISDEIYAGMVFDTVTPPKCYGELSYSAFAKGPCLLVGGLAKRYMVPGWRLGWVIVAEGTAEGRPSAAGVRSALVALSTLILGANSLIQAVVPAALDLTPDHEYHVGNNNKLSKLADTFCDEVAKVDGLEPVRPGGAMYVMIRVDTAKFGFADDVAFTVALLAEQNVQVLAGTIFMAPGFFRVVISNSTETLFEAARRIAVFCEAHRK